MKCPIASGRSDGLATWHSRSKASPKSSVFFPKEICRAAFWREKPPNLPSFKQNEWLCKVEVVWKIFYWTKTLIPSLGCANWMPIGIAIHEVLEWWKTSGHSQDLEFISQAIRFCCQLKESFKSGSINQNFKHWSTINRSRNLDQSTKWWIIFWNSMDLFSFCVKTLRLVLLVLLIFDFLGRPTGSAAVHVCPVKSWTSSRWNKNANRPGNTKLCKVSIFWFNRNQIELCNFLKKDSLGQFMHPYTLKTSSSFLATHEGVVVLGCCRFHEVVSEQQTYSVYCRLAAAPWQVLSWWCRRFRLVFFLNPNLWDNGDSTNPLFNYKRFFCWKKELIKWGNSKLHV